MSAEAPGRFDAIVIGGGSGGLAFARRAAALGARVALVEGDRLGGTCLQRGCVPKKLMVMASHLGGALREAGDWGWATVGDARFDMAQWQARKREALARIEAGWHRSLADAGVSLVQGWARLCAPGEVEVSASGDAPSQHLRAPHIVVATGSASQRAGVPGAEEAMTSDDVLALHHLPARIAIVGAGYIGVEMAGVLQGLGAQVDVFYRGEWPLGERFDADVRQRLAQGMAARGVRLHAGSRVACVGANSVTLQGAEAQGFDAVLLAIGRVPRSQGLGLERLGLTLGERGEIRVDAQQQTNCPGHYAIGDVTGGIALTPVAIVQGQALAQRLFGSADAPPHLPRMEAVPTAVFSQPALASVGPTETEAAQRGGALRIYEAEFKPLSQAFAGQPERAYIKLIVDDASDRVLALHLLGEPAPELIQAFAVAVTAGLTKTQWDATLAVHPTWAEEAVTLRKPSRR